MRENDTYEGESDPGQPSGKSKDLGDIVNCLERIIGLAAPVAAQFLAGGSKAAGYKAAKGMEPEKNSEISEKPETPTPKEPGESEELLNKINSILERLNAIEKNLNSQGGISAPSSDTADASPDIKEIKENLSTLLNAQRGDEDKEFRSSRISLEDIKEEISGLKSSLDSMDEKLAQEREANPDWVTIFAELSAIRGRVSELPRTFPSFPDEGERLDKIQKGIDSISSLLGSRQQAAESLAGQFDAISGKTGEILGKIKDLPSRLAEDLDKRLTEHFKNLGIDYERIDRNIKSALAQEQEKINKSREIFEKRVGEELEKFSKALASLEEIWRESLEPALAKEGSNSLFLSLKNFLMDKFHSSESVWQNSSNSLESLQADLARLQNDILGKNADLEQRNKNVEIELVQKKDELDRLQNAYEGIKKELDALRDEKKQMGSATVVLEERLEDSRKTIAGLEAQISANESQLAAERDKSASLEEKWQAWSGRLDFYEPVRKALLDSPFFSIFADREGIGTGESGLFNCMKRLGRSSDFLSALHKYASEAKKENAEAMQEDEIRVYDALNKCYRALLDKDFDYFVQSGDRPVTEPFSKVRFNKINDRHMREPNDRSRTWVQRIYVPMLRNDEGVMLRPAEVEAGND